MSETKHASPHDHFDGADYRTPAGVEGSLPVEFDPGDSAVIVTAGMDYLTLAPEAGGTVNVTFAMSRTDFVGLPHTAESYTTVTSLIPPAWPYILVAVSGASAQVASN